MSWSWKLARIAGIDVYVHVTFLMLIAWIAVIHWSEERSVTAVIQGVGFILALFACVVLHEYGHALTARHYGIKTRDITLLSGRGEESTRLLNLNGFFTSLLWLTP